MRTDQGSDNIQRTAERMESSGNMAAAAHFYRKLLETTTEDKLPIYFKLGEALIAAGDLDEARNVFEQALRVDRGDQAKGQLGRCYLLSGKPERAMPIFQEILKANPENVLAMNCLGVAHDMSKNHKAARDFYTKALALEPDNEEIKGNLGLSFAMSGNYKEALQTLVPIGERLGAQVKQRHNLAAVYALAGYEDKAAELFTRDIPSDDTQDSLSALRRVRSEPSSETPIADMKSLPEEAKSSDAEENSDPINKDATLPVEGTGGVFDNLINDDEFETKEPINETPEQPSSSTPGISEEQTPLPIVLTTQKGIGKKPKSLGKSAKPSSKSEKRQKRVQGKAPKKKGTKKAAPKKPSKTKAPQKKSSKVPSSLQKSAEKEMTI